MVGFILSLRFLMLGASFGAALGAVLMFLIGGAKLIKAALLLFNTDNFDAPSTTVAVMASTDAFLFGIVLLIFAYAVAFGFVFAAPPEERQVPAWMRMRSIRQLKRTLVEVILVYLIVDAATDMTAGDEDLTWHTLIKPVAILLIAGALRLLAGEHDGAEPPRPQAEPEL
jgi:uncharacterized membrane protein YqhA